MLLAAYQHHWHSHNSKFCKMKLTINFQQLQILINIVTGHLESKKEILSALQPDDKAVISILITVRELLHKKVASKFDIKDTNEIFKIKLKYFQAYYLFELLKKYPIKNYQYYQLYTQLEKETLSFATLIDKL